MEIFQKSTKWYWLRVSAYTRVIQIWQSRMTQAHSAKNKLKLCSLTAQRIMSCQLIPSVTKTVSVTGEKYCLYNFFFLRFSSCLVIFVPPCYVLSLQDDAAIRHQYSSFCFYECFRLSFGTLQCTGRTTTSGRTLSCLTRKNSNALVYHPWREYVLFPNTQEYKKQVNILVVVR